MSYETKSILQIKSIVSIDTLNKITGGNLSDCHCDKAKGLDSDNC